MLDLDTLKRLNFNQPWFNGRQLRIPDVDSWPENSLSGEVPDATRDQQEKSIGDDRDRCITNIMPDIHMTNRRWTYLTLSLPKADQKRVSSERHRRVDLCDTCATRIGLQDRALQLPFYEISAPNAAVCGGHTIEVNMNRVVLKFPLLALLTFLLHLPFFTIAVTPVNLPSGCFSPIVDTPCPNGGNPAEQFDVWTTDSKICAKTKVSSCFKVSTLFYETEEACRKACTLYGAIFVPPPGCTYPSEKISSILSNACAVHPKKRWFAVLMRNLLYSCNELPTFDCAMAATVVYYENAEACRASCFEPQPPKPPPMVTDLGKLYTALRAMLGGFINGANCLEIQ